MINTIDWMLTHKGVAVAKTANNNKSIVEIIKYSENPEEYSELKELARSGGNILIVGKGTAEEYRIGYLKSKL